MKADIAFKPPQVDLYKVDISSFSNSSFSVTQSSQYVHTGLVNGILYVSE